MKKEIKVILTLEYYTEYQTLEGAKTEINSMCNDYKKKVMIDNIFPKPNKRLPEIIKIDFE